MIGNRKEFANSKLKLLFIASLVFALIVLSQEANRHGLLQNALGWIQGWGPATPLAFIIVYNLATILCIPAALLTVGGGILFGVLWGTVYVLIAAIFGATLAFVIGRYFTRTWVDRQIRHHPKFRAVDEAVAREGFKIVLLTRLSPVFPFNLLNYAFGLTRVSLKDYVLGSLGIVPGTLMYVYMGSLVGDLAMLNGKSPAAVVDNSAMICHWMTQGIGFVATVGATFYVTRIAKKALTKAVMVAERSVHSD